MIQNVAIKKLMTAGDKMLKFGKNIKQTNSSLSSFNDLFSDVTDGAVECMAKFDIQAQAEAQVMQGLVSTNEAVGRSFEELKQQSIELQNNSLFGDEDILQNITAKLLTFTNIAGEQFDRTQQAALDLSARLGGDLKSSSIQLGEALNNPAANLSKLSELGIEFSEEQKNMIKSLQETNKMAEAQNIVLDELEEKFGGSAEAAAKAGTGPFKQLFNIVQDIQEEIGGFIFKILAPLIDWFKHLLNNLDPVKDAFKNLYEAVKPVFTSLGGLFKSIFGVNKETDRTKETISSFAKILNILAGVVRPIANVLSGLIDFIAILAAFVVKVLSAIKPLLIAYGLWTVVQWALNVALAANSIGLIIIGIVALIGAIMWVIKSTEGWGEQWEVLGNMLSITWDIIKLSFQAAWQFIKNYFFDTIDKMRIAWIEFKDFFGFSDEEDLKSLRKFQDQIEARADAFSNITDEIRAKSDELAAASKITVRFKDDKEDEKADTSTDTSKELVKKYNNGAPPVANNAVTSINQGGHKPTSITVSNLTLIGGDSNINVANAQEGAEELEDVILQSLTRGLQSLTNFAQQ